MLAPISFVLALLAVYTDVTSTITDAIALWASEVVNYDPKNPQYSHFTQEVWKASTQLGCAERICATSTAPFGVEYGNWKFYVCEYNPRGNIISAAQYAKNVQL
ncbi:hypothetical protein RQP46_010305 [Phenoliferia psychrophenolica]